MLKSKLGRMIVLSLALTLSVSFLTPEAVAQTNGSRHAGGRVQMDVPGLLAQAIAQGLATGGHEVHLDGTTVTIATQAGELILDLPATQEALERGEITVSIDGLVLHLDGASSPDLSELRNAKGGGILDLVDCVLSSVDIYGTCLDICEFSSSGIDFLCPIECTFNLVTNVLRCVGDPR